MSKRARDAKKAAEELELQEMEAAEQAAPQLTVSRPKKPAKPKAPPLTGPQKAAAVFGLYVYEDAEEAPAPSFPADGCRFR